MHQQVRSERWAKDLKYGNLNGPLENWRDPERVREWQQDAGSYGRIGFERLNGGGLPGRLGEVPAAVQRRFRSKRKLVIKKSANEYNARNLMPSKGSLGEVSHLV